MPTGVVLLDRSESNRNRQLCAGLFGGGSATAQDNATASTPGQSNTGTRGLTATVRREAAARSADPTGDVLVTHWLASSAVRDEGDCSELLARYDFARATQVKRIFGLSGAKGPIFLAGDPAGDMIFLDLSNATPEQVNVATDEWMNLALNPLGASPSRRAGGLSDSANRLFDRLAAGLGTGESTPSSERIAFTNPVTGKPATFRVYRSGAYRIGATFDF